MPAASRDVTVLTRFHNMKRLPLLDEALFSLWGQSPVSVRSRVLCQHLSDEDFGRVAAVCDIYKALGLDVVATNEVFDRKGDHRAELLNRGLSRVATRYLAFLDSDDVVYPACYQRLIERLDRTGAAIAFGGVIRCDYRRVNDHIFAKKKYRIFEGLPKARFFIDNQYPIHSFVMDLTAVDRRDLYFDVGASHHEDYVFLIRILRQYPYDTEECKRSLCEYRIDLNGDNTILADGDDAFGKAIKKRTQDYIEHARQERNLSISYRDLVELVTYHERVAAEQAAKSSRADPAQSPSGYFAFEQGDTVRNFFAERAVRRMTGECHFMPTALRHHTMDPIL